MTTVSDAIRAEVCVQLNGKLVYEDATDWVGRSTFEPGTFGILFQTDGDGGLEAPDGRKVKMAVRFSHDNVVFDLDPSEIDTPSSFLIIPILINTVSSTDMHTTNRLLSLNGNGPKDHIYMSLEGSSIPFSDDVATRLKGMDDFVFCTSVMEPLFDAMMWLRKKEYVLKGVLTGTDEPSPDVVRYDWIEKKIKLCCDSRWVEPSAPAVAAGTRSEFTPGLFLLEDDDIDNDTEEGTDDSWRRRKVMAPPTPTVVGYLTGSKYLAVLMWIKVFGGSPIPDLMTAERKSDPACEVLFQQAYIAALKRDAEVNEGDFALSAGVHFKSEGWEAGGARIENKGHASKSHVHLGASYSWLQAMMSSTWGEKGALFDVRSDDKRYIGWRKTDDSAAVTGYTEPYVPGLWFRRGFEVPSNPHVLTVLQFSDGLWILGIMEKAVPERRLPSICRTDFVPYAELIEIRAIIGHDHIQDLYKVEWAEGESNYQPAKNLPAELVLQYNKPQKKLPPKRGELDDRKVAPNPKHKNAKGGGGWQTNGSNKTAKERPRPETPPTTKRVPPAKEVTGPPSDSTGFYEVKEIVDKNIKKDGTFEYHIRWEGDSDDTWEIPGNLPTWLVERYERERDDAVSQREMDLAHVEYLSEPEISNPSDEGAVSNDGRLEDDRDDGLSGSPPPRPTGEPTTTTLIVDQDATRFHSSLAEPDPKRHKQQLWPW